jgi:hypothetical protein
MSFENDGFRDRDSRKNVLQFKRSAGMARPEISGRKPGAGGKSKPQAPLIRGPPRAMSIAEFCDAFRISIDFYFAMAKRGEGPRTMKIGARTLIPIEAVDEWQAAREAASKTAAE